MQTNKLTCSIIFAFSLFIVLRTFAQVPTLGRGTSMHRFIGQEDSYGQLSEEGIIPSGFIGNERRIGPLKDLFKEKLPFKTFFSGYIRNALYYDTRQVEGFADDYVLLFPEDKKLSVCNRDINAHGQVDIIPLESRLIWYIFGPNVGEARTHAKISTDFIEAFDFEFDSIFHKLRLREIYFMLHWKTTSLLIGQNWHPISLPLVAPNTVSFNQGAPFAPGTRNPQMRCTYYHAWCEILFTALSQADFKSNGPDGITTKYTRDALVPSFNVTGKVFFNDYITGGASGNYLRLVPRLMTNKNFKTNEAINSFAFASWGEFVYDPYAFYTKVTYAENGGSFGVLGQYAVTCVNPITDRREYTNLRSVSWWADFSIQKKIEPAFFIGYLKNLGAKRRVLQEIVDENGVVEITNYSFFPKLDTVFRFAPRVRYLKEPFELGAEIEYTRSVYGTPGPKGKIENPDPPVFNVRFIVALAYYF